MKIVHINCSEKSGGAAIAAHRLHEAQKAIGLESTMVVARGTSSDPSISTPNSAIKNNLYRVGGKLDSLICKLVTGNKSGIHQSAGLIGSDTVYRALRLKPDIVNLHWINGACVSLLQLKHIKCPIIWTLHDTWPLAGLDHYEKDSESDWYKVGGTRLSAGRANRAALELKKRYTPSDRITVVGPSKWISNCAYQSEVFRGSKIATIPNCIDTDFWSPVEKSIARAKLGIQHSTLTLLFSSSAGFRDSRKGGDLLIDLVSQLKMKFNLDITTIVLGDSDGAEPLSRSSRLVRIGSTADQNKMKLAYCAADITVVPSRLDNLPNVALESMACGRPVSAFRVGGLPDLISKGETGILSEPFKVKDMAEQIALLITDPERLSRVSERARQYVTQTHNKASIARKYQEVYENIIG